jgi:hypothetical protein
MTKSPFPGMDPYLEQSWRDVHHKLCTYSCDDLQEQLGEGLIARIDERLVVELPAERPRSVYPDVRVVERPGGALQPASTAALTITEPLAVEVDFEDEAHYEGFIEIMDPKGGTVITVIEFLSQSNKAPDGRDDFLKKQRELRLAGVSLVEINLLRAGFNVTQVPTRFIPERLRAPYYAVVHRAWDGKIHWFYSMPLRAPLPKIKIPLRQTDTEATLDLQALINRVYRNGAYHLEIDYSNPPTSPLDEQDAKWASELTGNPRA